MFDANSCDIPDPEYELLIAVLVRNWWAVGIRGAVAIAFGIVALVFSHAAMLSLVSLFAAYVFVDGVFLSV